MKCRICFAVVALLIFNRAGAAESPAPAVRASAVAKELYTALEQRMAQGEALDLPFLEQVYTWSQRWAKSEGDEAKSKTDRVAAWRGHARRMEELRDSVTAFKYDAELDPRFRLAVIYYVAEATAEADRAERG